jgi:hypothetical protein
MALRDGLFGVSANAEDGISAKNLRKLAFNLTKLTFLFANRR